MVYRTKLLRRKENSASSFGNAVEHLTDEQRARTFRRIASELIARQETRPASFGPSAAEYDVTARAVAAIAHRARISLPHAAVIAELAKIGGGRQ